MQKNANAKGKKKFEKNLVTDADTNPKSFYCYVHSMAKTKEKVGPLKDRQDN